MKAHIIRSCQQPLQLLLLLLLLLTCSGNCYAQLSGSLTGTTDYMWRGYSKSDGKPALQVNLDYELRSGFYIGSFASFVDFADEGFKDQSNIELRPYLGWAYKLSDDWQFNTEWVRYIYDGRIFGEKVDYNEFYFFGHYRDLLTANFSFSEDGYQQNHATFNYEITGRYPINDSIEISSMFGYSNQKEVLHYDYYYWNIGLAWHVSHNLGFDVRYYNGDIFGSDKEISSGWQFDPHIARNRVVFSFTVGF